ncbi:MAG: PRC-barrel domain-containing protein [Desulfopila sp.]
MILDSYTTDKGEVFYQETKRRTNVMKRYASIYSMAGILIFFCLSMDASYAQQSSAAKKNTDNKQTDIYRAAEGEKINAFMVNNIIGSTVRNMDGEELGTIEDIIVDIDTGQVMYAVMDFGGFLGIGGKLFPVNWQALAPLPSEGIFFLDIEKDKLKSAPAYDMASLPDMGDRRWGQEIAAFYKAYPEEQYYASANTYGYGIGLYPNIAKQDPFAELFDPESIKEISGEVIKVEHIVPETGVMAQMQTKLIVFINQNEPVPVYLGPRWYVTDFNEITPFKTGDKVTVTGSWITSRTEPFMIAAKLSKNNNTFRFRQKDGMPVWNDLTKETEKLKLNQDM